MEALVAIGGIVALVWLAVVLLRGGLLGGCLAVLLAGSVFGHPLFNLPVGPVPLTADRLLWVLLLVQYALWRRLGLADPKPLGRAEIVLCVFVGVLVLSTLTHDWQSHNARAMSRLVFYFIMPLGIYWVARQSKLSQRSFQAILGFLSVFGIYLAVTAIAEQCQLWWLVYPKYIASPAHAEFWGRGRGPFLNPAATGFCQGVGLSATWLWWPRLNRIGKLLLPVVSVLFGLGLYSTMTRSVWMGAGLGLFVLAALTIPRSWRVVILGGSVLAATLVATTQWEHLVAFKRDRGLSARYAAESVKLRPILAMVAWKMFLDRPLLGCGFGQYPDESVRYLADRSTELPLEKARPFHQHNVFLALLTETGLVGMGLFAALLMLWARDAWRLWKSPNAPSWARHQALLFLTLLGVYFPNAMFHDVSLIPMFNMLLFFLAGVTAGLRPPVDIQPRPC